MRRLVAEESLMSSITFATTVAASHFIPVADAADADVLPADNVLARKMQQYMAKSGGGRFRCVLPNLLINFDATTLLIHTQTQKGGPQWYASSVDDTKERRSIFTPGTRPASASLAARRGVAGWRDESTRIRDTSRLVRALASACHTRVQGASSQHGHQERLEHVLIACSMYTTSTNHTLTVSSFAGHPNTTVILSYGSPSSPNKRCTCVLCEQPSRNTPTSYKSCCSVASPPPSRPEYKTRTSGCNTPPQ